MQVYSNHPPSSYPPLRYLVFQVHSTSSRFVFEVFKTFTPCYLKKVITIMHFQNKIKKQEGNFPYPLPNDCPIHKHR